MKRFDASFQSCGEFQELFQPLSPDLVALQLSQGPLVGRLRIYSLGGFNFNLLEANQSLFLSGTRRPKPCTMVIPLVDHDPSSEDHYRAQGITMPWPGLMGYNRWLTDFDLKNSRRRQVGHSRHQQTSLARATRSAGWRSIDLEALGRNKST